MTYDLQDTICAIATPPAGAARGVVRFSGPQALQIADQLFRPAEEALPLQAIRVPSAVAGHIALGDPIGPVEAEALVWPTTRSYTRQITVELHTLGCLPILEAVLSAIIAAGGRLAEPGEFTLRAFLAGRLDLTQAEAVLGVIDAHDQRSLDSALSQLAGGLAVPLATIRSHLLDLLAHLEAGLDFVEEDIEFISAEQLQADVATAATSVAQLAAQMESRGSAGTLCKVVIVGWPNVGKSSLLNALASSDAALVSPTAGATRDYVSYSMRDGNVSYELIDTAGVCDVAALAEVDRSAQSVTQQLMAQADLQLFCLDATRQLNPWELAQLHTITAPRLVVRTKADMAAANTADALIPLHSLHTVSSTTGAGLQELRTAIAEQLAAHNAETSTVAGTAQRCRESLLRAAEGLDLAADASVQGFGEEVVAVELRLALEEIGKVAGVVYTDDVLDRIFSRFCIGK